MEYYNLFIQNPANLRCKTNQLIIEQGSSESTFPIEDISSIMIESQHVNISSYLLAKLAENGIHMFVCDDKHLPSGVFLPTNRHSRLLKQYRLQIELNKPFQKRMWQKIIQMKIHNQALCLDYVNQTPDRTLYDMIDEVRSGDITNIEAKAAAYYFRKLFGNNFARNDSVLINGALNYGYAILRSMIARNLIQYGLEPCLGIFHQSELNNFNLADDLFEPYRPVVDLFVASKLTDCAEAELTASTKGELFNITNLVTLIDDRKYRISSAITQTVISYSKSLETNNNALQLPKLLRLESYRYE